MEGQESSTLLAPCLVQPVAQPGVSSRWRKVLLAVVMFLVCGEIGSRVFWWYQRGAPLFALDSLWYAYYPQLHTSGVEDTVITNTDTTYDILILGGSAISEGFGTVGKDFGEGCAKLLDRPVRVYNLAYAAHNTRDSLLKFRHLARQQFDLVVIYHGINDARMNCASPELFQDDYGHASWYKHVNFLESHPRLCKAGLPFTLYYTYNRVAELCGTTTFISRLDPDAASREFGQDIRTRDTFRRNLEEIVNSARDKGTRVLLMTYAYHAPAGLVLDDPHAEHADYASGKSAFFMWGKPVHVIKAVDVHNEVIRELAAQHPEVTLVDQAKLMPRSGKVFVDCCHLTRPGCKPFVEHMLSAMATDAR